MSTLHLSLNVHDPDRSLIRIVSHARAMTFERLFSKIIQNQKKFLSDNVVDFMAVPRD